MMYSVNIRLGGGPFHDGLHYLFDLWLDKLPEADNAIEARITVGSEVRYLKWYVDSIPIEITDGREDTRFKRVLIVREE